MAITATTTSKQRELIPVGNYIARCYQMIEIGTIKDTYLGEPKISHKVRIGWELPTETRVFKEENGEQPFVISKEYTLSLGEKSNLRKDLKSWRGVDFTEDQARAFDITKLIGVPCLLNIIHKPSKDGSKVYEEIAGITPIPKGMQCPAQISKTLLLEYDNFSYSTFDMLPDFLKDKIKTSLEYTAMQQPNHADANQHETNFNNDSDDLPF